MNEWRNTWYSHWLHISPDWAPASLPACNAQLRQTGWYRHFRVPFIPFTPQTQPKPALSLSMCLLIPGLAQPSRAKGVSQAEDPRPPFTIVNRGCTLPVSKESQDIKEKQTSGIPPEISPLSSWYNLPQAWKLRDGPSCLVTSLVHR